MTGWRAWPAALLVLLAGCHRLKEPASVVRMGDPATANQLIGGFYNVEGGAGNDAWRWTAPEFAVALAPPAAAPHGTRLLLRLYFPETQIQKLGPMTLTAFLDGQPLEPETYDQGGIHDFVREIPACFLETNVLPITFSFDPYSPRSATEGRDLGAVVLLAALEAKP